MKTTLVSLITAGATALLVAGCSTYDKGPYLPEVSKTPPYEKSVTFVALDPGVRRSIACTAIHERTLEDGRLEVIAQIRNRENRRLEVQVNCVFKDQNAFSTGDETPFQTLILTENATQDVRFVSMNSQAKKYTVRVREAR